MTIPVLFSVLVSLLCLEERFDSSVQVYNCCESIASSELLNYKLINIIVTVLGIAQHKTHHLTHEYKDLFFVSPNIRTTSTRKKFQAYA